MTTLKEIVIPINKNYYCTVSHLETNDGIKVILHKQTEWGDSPLFVGAMTDKCLVYKENGQLIKYPPKKESSSNSAFNMNCKRCACGLVEAFYDEQESAIMMVLRINEKRYVEKIFLIDEISII